MLETLETPVHSPEKKIVLKAISESPAKITVADVASKTSLPVLQTNALLNQIAYETGAHLRVGTAGSIVYEFAPNFESAYLSRGSKDFFRRSWRVIYNGSAYLLRIFTLFMFFVIRVSFGILLIVSVVLIVALVVIAAIALLSKLMGDNDDSGDFNLGGIFGGMGGLFRYWVFDWLWDWWYWGSYIRWDPAPQYQYDQGSNTISQQTGKKESFLDKCFSFLFGDGDPNSGLELRYWQTIALVLKSNSGVVVAEQLAPYAVTEGKKNEDWVLPILVRFNGTCDVSENGNIIYSFPSFQQDLDTSKPGEGSSISSEDSPKSSEDSPKSSEELHQLFESYVQNKKIKQAKLQALTHLEPYLKENLWQLTHIDGGSKFTIICFALFILIGSIWLSTLAVAMPLFLALSPLLVAIAAYGAMFFVIPGIRTIFNNARNAEIEKRNSSRYLASKRMENADDDLIRKLADAEQARKIAIRESRKESVVFSTDRDALEQEVDQALEAGKSKSTEADADLVDVEAPPEIIKTTQAETIQSEPVTRPDNLASQ